MPPRLAWLPLLVVGFFALGSGCAGTQEAAPTGGDAGARHMAPERVAVDVPDHFMIGTDSGGMAEPIADGTCRNPIVDPRDGTRLILIRSADSFGDYEPPLPRYGLGKDDLLRVECSTGKAYGIVKH